jgi:hypothetical protein
MDLEADEVSSLHGSMEWDWMGDGGGYLSFGTEEEEVDYDDGMFPY